MSTATRPPANPASNDTRTRLVLGCDSAGQPLMDVIENWLQSRSDVDTRNLSQAAPGADETYADMTDRVTNAITSGEAERGILICGTGIGVCISANKVPGIRAALTHDTYSAERAQLSNDAQVITMGARVVGPELAKNIVAAWLDAHFDPASHSAANVASINALDDKYKQ